MNWYVVTPAYGRDYKSSKLALDDWNKGLDFVLQPTGQYCSNRDFRKIDSIEIRYQKLTKLVIGKGGKDA